MIGGAEREGGGAQKDGEPARSGNADRADPVAGLSLRRQVGLLLISSFDETEMPDYIRRRLAAGETAGVILFGRNGGDAAQWRNLTRALQRPAKGRALVMVDQEGGDIRTLAYAGPVAGQALQGTAAEVERTARATGRELSAAGVNVNLAPVADVARPGSIMASRAFPGDAASVAEAIEASVRGLTRAGVAATVKHFPGLGGATVNTDDAPATVPGELDEDLVPYRAAIDAGTPLIMASHALYPALDDRAIASQSRTIISGLLREQLGFAGVIVTDSMEAQAVLARSDVATAAERSVEAGVDLILMTGSASWNDVFPRLLARARRDRVFRKRVAESAARVLALKRSLR
ncbi:MAG TPA: glycoside hydrolase family 3 N-terminal domain-containing protein [Thermoleophilaceae bacterium]|nr:glycoside hydrolase family 3 N-terminal domain-containing protein [Thermoleophilaceae bacterium]